jgi:hypothetical protein
MLQSSLRGFLSVNWVVLMTVSMGASVENYAEQSTYLLGRILNISFAAGGGTSFPKQGFTGHEQ